MMGRSTGFRAVAISLVVLAAMVPNVARAHPADDFFNRKWGTNNRVVPWRFTESFPGTNSSNFRMRMQDGAAEWNSVNSVDLEFNFEGAASDYSSYSMFTCPDTRPLQKDAVHWVSDLPNTVFAVTNLCEGSSGGAHDVQIGLNSDPPSWWSWYKDDGTPSSDEKDAFGTASHEFGHAAGYWKGDGHFAESDAACPGQNDLANRNTMCVKALNSMGNVDKDIELGTTWKRTLESHDIHTFQNSYPP